MNRSACAFRFACSHQSMFILSILLSATEALAETGDLLHRLSTTGAKNFDRLGWSVAISGNRALAGAVTDAGGSELDAPTALYDVSTGQQLHSLIPDDLSTVYDTDFGYSVALNNSFAIVGAPDDNQRGFLAGAAYVFDASTGAQLHKLTATDGNGFQRFGFSAAVDDTTALIGATTAAGAYLFNISTGEQLHKLVVTNEAPGDTYGSAVGIAGGAALVGAPLYDGVAHASGSVYQFDVATGQQVRKMTASDASGADLFGSAIAVNGNLAIVGAPGDDHNLGVNAGSAYVFNVNNGQQLVKLVAQDGAAQDQFGTSVALFGNLALVSAPYHDSALRDGGAAYLFEISSGQQLAKFSPLDVTRAGGFGWSVAVSQNVAMLGAPFESNVAFGDGAAYLFSVVPEPASITLSMCAVCVFCLAQNHRRTRAQ